MEFNRTDAKSNFTVRNAAYAGTAEQVRPTLDTAAKLNVNHLLPGKVISGEIISKNGSEVVIANDKNETFSARLEGNFNLSEGDTVNFYVKSNANGRIVLQPLLENLDMTELAGHIIKQAGIPYGEDSLALVSMLVKEGMPVDEKTLQNLYKTMIKNSPVLPETIVNLTKLGIPITEKNIFQMQNYDDLRKGFADNMVKAAQNLAQAFEEVEASAGEKPATRMFMEAMNILWPKTEAKIDEANIKTAQTGEMIAAASETAIETDSETASKTKTTPLDLTAATRLLAGAGTGTVFDENDVILKDVLNRTGTSPVQINDIVTKDGIQNTISNPALADEADSFVQKSAENTLIQFSTDKEREQLSQTLTRLGVSPQDVRAAATGQMTWRQLIDIAREAFALRLFNESDLSRHNAVKELIKDEVFQKALMSGVRENWMLPPDQVDSEKLTELYAKIRRQTAQLLEVARNYDQIDSRFAKDAAALRENADFTHHMAQNYTYVQMPIALKGGQATGELYVYSKKKKQSSKDGVITAFMRLSTSNLGTLDINLTLDQSKLSAGFAVENVPVLKFLKEELPALKERLTERGYTVIVNADKSERIKTVIDEIKEDLGSASPIQSQFAFDLRV